MEHINPAVFDRSFEGETVCLKAPATKPEQNGPLKLALLQGVWMLSDGSLGS